MKKGDLEDYTSPCGKHYCLYHYRTGYYQLHEVKITSKPKKGAFAKAGAL